MDANENYLIVFTGKVVDVNFINKHLKTNNIHTIIENAKSDNPSWAKEDLSDIMTIGVKSSDFEIAEKLIRSYYAK